MMPFIQLKEEEKRSICKKEIENLEIWIRRLIHESLSKEYGSDYLEYKDRDNNYLIKAEIRQSVKDLINKEPKRFPRCIDAFFLPDLIYITCKNDLYNKFFKEPFLKAFPDGNNEARTFLARLVDPRNALYHANPISNRQAEQVICYCRDIIDSLKEYYDKVGVEKEYNVPRIIKITDSFANTIHSNELGDHPVSSWFLHKDHKSYLRPGDKLGIEVEIDPSFDHSSYTVKWNIENESIEKFTNKTKISFEIDMKHVGVLFRVTCRIISNKSWHKYKKWDDLVQIYYKVLPPINDH